MNHSLQRLRDILWSRPGWFILAFIIGLATLGRFWSLGLADPLTDEPSYLFRSLGYFDFLASPYQTTPLEWSSERAWWTWLSFHDHPPFHFLLQFLLFKITGVSLVAGRILPALAGVGTVVIIFDLLRRLSDLRVAVIGGLLLAVNAHMLWISRIGLQESLVLFLVFLSLWLTHQLIRRRRAYLWVGAVMGLAIMTKLTAIIIVPLTLLFWFIVHRDEWRWSKVLSVLLVAGAFFLPQAVYNLAMYNQYHHFDFQFSYYFQQASPWLSRPGRAEFASQGLAARYFLPNLRSVISPVAVLLFMVSLFLAVWLLWRHKLNDQSRIVYYLLIATCMTSLWLLFIGPSWRFLSLLLPWLLMIVAFILARITKVKFLSGLVCLILIWEILFSWNTIFSLDWPGKRQWTYSAAKAHEYPYGYNQLEKALQIFYDGKRPAIVLPVASPVINQFVQQRAVQMKGEAVARVLIYDPRLYGEPLMWSLTRRLVYQGWPMISLDVYQEVQQGRSREFFQTLGLTEYYYLRKMEAIPAGTANEAVTNAMNKLEVTLEAENFPYQSVYNLRGEEVFRLYTINSDTI